MTASARTQVSENPLDERRSPQGRDTAGRLTANRGRKLGRWTLLKPLARGGMGEVYLATAGGIEGAERPCVVKLIRQEHAKDKSFLARFFDEARIQAQLQHPGVAQVLEASTDPGGMPYVVLEYIEGRNLGEVRQRAAQLGVALSWADAVAIAVTLAEALSHVHERTDARGRALQIVHRDLSPQNVMVAYDGDTKLIDFGTARGENRRCQTVAGIVFAKPGYVAPEVANNTPGGPAADLYALGIILWELIMGRRFLSGDAEEHLAEVASGRRNPPPVSLTNNVPLELDTVIARLTAFDVRDRFASAREAKTELLRALKRAPSLADGERGVRARISHLMARLYPSEPARSRAEFAVLLKDHRKHARRLVQVPDSPSPRAADARELFPGTRYRIVRELSKTPMSVVYEALHIDLARKVALKVLPREHCKDPRFERRFRTEARALATIRHSNLVSLHDFGVSQDGRPYYAMEFLEGVTLRHRLTEEVLPWPRALRWGSQILSALSAVHEQGIIHRDVKPENVFITHDGIAKLLDLGIARVGQGESDIEDNEQSGALQLMGTVEYMAPEQFGSGQIDERADVYSVGVMLYELVTGQLPHRADGTIQLQQAKRSQVPMVASRRAPERRLPPELDRALHQALSADPSRRFSSAAELQAALERALSAPERKRRRARQLVASAAALVGFALAFFTYSTLRKVPLPLGDLARNLDSAVHPGLESQAEQRLTRTEGKAQLDDASEPKDELPTFDETSHTVPLDEPALEEPTPAESSPDEKAERQGHETTRDDASSIEPLSSASRDADQPNENRNPEIERLFLEQLEQAKRLSRAGSGGHERALEMFRALAAQHPNHPQLLEHWSKTAAHVKWWGESLRVAIRWASVDSSEASQLHLARTQRLVGQRYGAIQTLERLLERMPENPKALALLEKYRRR